MKALSSLLAGVALGWALPRGLDALAAVVAAALLGILLALIFCATDLALRVSRAK